MKNLYVSLKVRVVKNGMEVPKSVEQHIGKVGIITGKLSGMEKLSIWAIYRANVDWEVLLEGGVPLVAASECLEPILPSGFTRSTETHEEFMERVRKGVTDELPS